MMNEHVYLVGIAGGTGAGKTVFTQGLVEEFGDPSGLGVMELDWYYHDVPGADPLQHNFDEPAAYDLQLLLSHLGALRRGETIQRPVYDYRAHRRAGDAEPFGPYRVVVVEGILTLSLPELAEQFDLRVFVDYPADLRLIRRLQRDRAERGRDVDSVLGQWVNTVRPMHETYIEPQKSRADIVVPGEDNASRVNFVAARLRQAISTTA